MVRRILFLCLAAAGSAQETSPPTDLELLVRRLGSSDPKERDSASAELLKRGKPIRPRLVLATKESDPEIAARARELLDRIDASLDSAREFFAALAEQERGSYQRYLWRAYHWLDNACRGKEWPDVWPVLRSQGFLGSRMYEQQNHWVSYQVRIPGETPLGSTGLRHDLYLNFEVHWAPAALERSRAAISRVSSELRATPRARLEDFTARKLYAEGTVLSKALDHDEARKTAATHPYLQEIQLEYMPLMEKWSGQQIFRFWGRLTFVDSIDLRRKSASLSIDAHSRLDPVREHNGTVLTPNHVPQDGLNSVSIRQSGSSQAGFDHGLVSLDRPHLRSPVTWSGSDTLQNLAYSVGDLDALPEDTEHISLKSKGSTDTLAGKLSRFRRLRTLQGGELGDEGLLAVGSLPALEELWCSIPVATDRGIEALSRSPKLRKLGLYKAAEISDDGLKRLAELKGLIYLQLYGARKLTTAGLEALASLPALEELRLSGCAVSEAGFQALSRCGALRRLQLWEQKDLTPESLDWLSRIAMLRELTFTYCPLDDASFERLSKIKTLEYLEVYYHSPPGTLSDQALLAFRSHASLRALHLSKTQVTAEGTRALAESLPGKFLPY